MQVVLVMFRDGGEPRSFAVTHDITVIGRRDDCDLRIPLGEVSRKHCRLVQEAGTLRVEDLGSSNGTYVNGERIQHATLGPGDSLQVGPIVFVAQIDGVPEIDQMQPVRFEAAAEPDAAGAGARAAAGAAGAAGGDDAFDPLDALTAPENEDSAFEFTIEEEMAEAAAALGGGGGGADEDAGAVADSGEDDVVDLNPTDELDTGAAAGAGDEDDALAVQDLEAADDDAPIAMADEEQSDVAEDDVIDLEESEQDRKA